MRFFFDFQIYKRSEQKLFILVTNILLHLKKKIFFIIFCFIIYFFCLQEQNQFTLGLLLFF